MTTAKRKQTKQEKFTGQDIINALSEDQLKAACTGIAQAHLVLSKLGKLKWKQYENGDVSAAIEMRLYERDGKLCAAFYDENVEIAVSFGDDDQIYRDDALLVTGADAARPLLELARRPENRGERE